jgi:hypothetical protein
MLGPDSRVVNVPYSEANSHKNDVVRWGRFIVDIENEENHSLILVEFHPLDESGHPQLDQPSEGEFVIKTSKPLDSGIYVEYSEITVVGTLNGYVKRRVQGRWPYNDVSMPLIVVNDPQNLYTWEKDYWMGGLGGIDARGGIDSSLEPKGKTALLFKNVAGFIMTIPFCALSGLGKSADDLCIGMFANSIRKIYMDL